MNYKIVFVCNSDRHFLTHRINIGLYAKSKGWNVTVIAPDSGYADVIKNRGLNFVDIQLSEHGLNLRRDICYIIKLRSLLEKLSPDIVHLITVKCLIYGALASRDRKDISVVGAVTGVGYPMKLHRRHPVRIAAEALYAFSLRGRGTLIFQNVDDYALLQHAGAVLPEQAVLIEGAGVDIERYQPTPEPDGTPVVLLPARVQAQKGVREFAAAAQLLRCMGIAARFVLVGPHQSNHPAAITRDELESWITQGIIEWWGFREDMVPVYRAATVVALPSYREGLPKVLLEASASARTIVATDVPGCNSVVADGKNGLLVPPRDAEALAAAIQRALRDRALRDRLRRKARETVVAKHAVERVVAAHFDLYERIMKSHV